MRPHSDVDAASAAARRDIYAWRRASNRLAALSNTALPDELHQEAWQVVRHAQLLAHKLQQSMLRSVVAQLAVSAPVSSPRACLKCACCSDMGRGLLKLQRELAATRGLVLDWNETARAVDAGLQGVLFTCADPLTARTEIERLRLRLFAQADAMPPTGGGGR